VLILVACDEGDDFEPNHPPTVEITGGAADGEETHYRVEFSWIGRDRDGAVDHYVYAIDDTCLCSTEMAWAPLEMTLSRLGGYRLLYWNVSDPGTGSDWILEG
jgi:hypothetical protein